MNCDCTATADIDYSKDKNVNINLPPLQICYILFSLVSICCHNSYEKKFIFSDEMNMKSKTAIITIVIQVKQTLKLYH